MLVLICEFIYENILVNFKKKKKVTENDQWRTNYISRIQIHMFRKLPEIVEYTKTQKSQKVKESNFLLKKGLIKTSVSLSENKTIYFMFYHSIPLRFEIDNQTKLKISDVKIILQQNLYYRNSKSGNGIRMEKAKLFALNVSDTNLFPLPIQKYSSVAAQNISIPLHHENITPTICPRLKTLIFVKHSIKIKIVIASKQVSNIKIDLPITILEPPIEHLQKAIYIRAQKQIEMQQHQHDQQRHIQCKQNKEQEEKERIECEKKKFVPVIQLCDDSPTTVTNQDVQTTLPVDIVKQCTEY